MRDAINGGPSGPRSPETGAGRSADVPRVPGAKPTRRLHRVSLLAVLIAGAQFVTVIATASAPATASTKANAITAALTKATASKAVSPSTREIDESGPSAVTRAATADAGEKGTGTSSDGVGIALVRSVLYPADGGPSSRLDSSAATALAPSTAARSIVAGAAVVPDGSISGTVSAASSGSDLAGVCVDAFETGDGGNYSSATTADNGSYTIAGLIPSSYTVAFDPTCSGSPGAYAPEFYDAQTSYASANLVTVTAGASTSGIDAALVPVGSISGTVTAASAGGVGGVCVDATESGTGIGYGYATTAADGTYTVTGLSAGSYTLVVDPTCDDTTTSAYAPQYYGGVTSDASAGLVTVASGETTPAIDATLTLAGSISGTVSASSGSDLDAVCVDASESGSAISGGYAATGADGTYTISGLPAGRYTVSFDPTCAQDGYAPEYYNGETSYSSADLVTVGTGATTSGIDAVLTLAGSISGTVTGLGGTDLAGVCIDVSEIDGGANGFASTGPDGTYTVLGLTSGSYAVELDPTCSGSEASTYAPQYYEARPGISSADPVAVTSGATTTGIDGALVLGGTITGTVTAASGGADLLGVCVTASEPSDLAGVTVTSGSTGAYTISSLPAGSYTVEFDPTCAGSTTSTYAAEYDASATSYAAASLVAVTSGATTAGVDAGLVVGGSIDGTVTAASSGGAASGVCATATEPGGIADATTTTGPDGSYSLTGLSAGSYTVELDPGCDGSSPSPLEFQYFSNTVSAETATPVTVALGETSSGIDAALVTGTIQSPPVIPLGATAAASATSGLSTGTALAALGTLTASGRGVGALTIAQYGSDPATAPPIGAGAAYLDVAVSPDSSFTSLSVQLCGLSSGQVLDWYDGSRWSPFSDQSARSGGCITATVSGSTLPTIADLTGTVIAATPATPAPAVTAVSPSSGPTTGGTAVTITGTGFSGTTKVAFGTVPATSFTVVSASEITAVSPAEASELHNIFVTTPAGSSTAVSSDGFTYVAVPAIPAAPAVTAVSPSSGPTTGGTTVTITGTGFSGATKVAFGSLPATSFTVVSATEITAVAPGQAPAVHNIIVTTAGGSSRDVAGDDFTYAAPTTTTTTTHSSAAAGSSASTASGSGATSDVPSASSSTSSQSRSSTTAATPRVPRIRVRSAARVSAGRVRVSVTCESAACAGTITLTGSRRVVVHEHSKTTHMLEVVRYGFARYGASPGETVTVEVVLDRAGQAALAKVADRRLTVVQTVTVVRGTSARRTIVLRVFTARRQSQATK